MMKVIGDVAQDKDREIRTPMQWQIARSHATSRPRCEGHPTPPEDAKHLIMEWVSLWPNESSLFLILPRSTQVMKTFLASVVVLLVFGGVMADLTVLMYTDSSFEDYVGLVRFDSTDRCYPLCSDTEAVAAFVWDTEPYGTQLAVFEDFECRGRFVTGERSTEAEFAAIAARHKVRSFILSTTKSYEATRGIVHSCEEKSDLVYKPFNDTAVWM